MMFHILVLRYTSFALMATAANLVTQRIILIAGESTEYFATAIVVGTIVGLVIKYLLDKRWIFYDGGTGLKDYGRKFSLYTAMGLVTTVIFWGSETSFWLIWQSNLMRELGAILGLSVGYVIKYNLDRRYVFTDGQVRAAV